MTRRAKQHSHEYAAGGGRCVGCGQYMPQAKGVAGQIAMAAGMKCKGDHKLGAKCDMPGCDMGDEDEDELTVEPEMTMATTWDDVDAEDMADDQLEDVAELTSDYMGLVQSILGNMMLDATARGTLLVDAASGYAERLQQVLSGQDEGMKAVRPGWLARRLGAKVTNSAGLGPDDFAVVPDPKTPSTWKLQINDATHISGAIQALSPAGFRGNKAQLDPGDRTKAIGRIRSAINKIPAADRGNLSDRLDALKATTEPAKDGSVVLLAGKEGSYDRFAMWASNNFRDREGEIFPAAAIRDAVGRLNARDGVKGHANTWHVGHPEYGWRGYPREMSDWGEIEHAAYADGFLFVEGRVTNQAVAAGIKSWADTEPLGTSIEYAYRDSDRGADGVYDAFDFDRVSVLPRRRASNPWGPDTAISLGKGEQMPFESADQRAALIQLWGEDQVKGWETEAEAKAIELKARGLAAKQISVQPPAVTLTFVQAVKDDTASVADATPPTMTLVADVPAAEAEPPAWAKALADQLTAFGARLDQQDAAVKAVSAELAGAAPAVGVFGRSVQAAGLYDAASAEAKVQQDAIDHYKATGQAPNPDVPGSLADWGIAGQIMQSVIGTPNGVKPAGS